MKALFDTNILIDYLNGIEAAKLELGKFDERYISIISYMEVLTGIKDPGKVIIVKSFLKSFSMVGLDLNIADLVIKHRHAKALKIPDAIILASAETKGCLLVTRNTKDFSESNPIVRVPYKITH